MQSAEVQGHQRLRLGCSNAQLHPSPPLTMPSTPNPGVAQRTAPPEEGLLITAWTRGCLRALPCTPLPVSSGISNTFLRMHAACSVPAPAPAWAFSLFLTPFCLL